MLQIKSKMGCYLVGGCVRDSILNTTPNDYDIVVDGDINQLLTLLEDNGLKCSIVGDSFKIISVHMVDRVDVIEPILSGNITFKVDTPSIYQIAPFRGEDIFSDAFSRDFTINSIYFDPFSNTIIDPTGNGVDDVLSKTLRFVGNGEDRIKEDEIRVLRAYRFIANGFKPTPNLLRTIRTNFHDAMHNSSSSRVMLEIEKIVGLM
jgi:poly(A) polymerase